MEKYTNALIAESSPYLLQHAHNPVDWIAWSDDVFDIAKAQNKLVLISVGYSACHWCHVMEHTCFEDEEVAAVMNKFFLNVKVDREERPDVDELYMAAVQLMTGKGGWPLNCFTLPDGRPFYGGTYFPKEQWLHILKSLQHLFATDIPKLESYGDELLRAINESARISGVVAHRRFEQSVLEELFAKWSVRFDKQYGGDKGAPKFPLPGNLQFQLDYALQRKDEELLNHVRFSLLKIAQGGIYDQIGGGFARYTVDAAWKIPHFEKMLYDNAQLIELYARAYTIFGDVAFKKVVAQTIGWLTREMHHPSGAFYAALDADSEGEEGKFYVWTTEELKAVLKDDFEWVSNAYGVDGMGYWEEGKQILLRALDTPALSTITGWDEGTLEEKLDAVNERLLEQRNTRVRPGLDNKRITSWNAMMSKALYDAYRNLGDQHYLDLAEQNMEWLLSQKNESGALLRIKEDRKTIDAFLEDYAHTINALLSGFFATGNSTRLLQATQLLDQAIDRFMDPASGMFYSTNNTSRLIARRIEIQDSVIPSANSVLARCMYYLGKITMNEQYVNRARQMLAHVYEQMPHQGSAYANWGILLNHEVFGLYEFVCTGDERSNLAFAIYRKRIPYSLVIFDQRSDTQLSIIRNKNEVDSKIFACTEGICFPPCEDADTAVADLMK